MIQMEKQSFLGGFSYHRNCDEGAIDHGDSQVKQYANPIVELSRIPNGQFNFQLADYTGNVIPYQSVETNSGTQKLQQTALVFQLYLVKSPHIKSQVMI